MTEGDNILLLGGLGYIGSHSLVSLARHFPDANFYVLDNLGNSSIECLRRLETITKKRIRMLVGDICDAVAIQSIFLNPNNKFRSVIHFAALKNVGESTVDPLAYFKNNISGFVNVLEAMVLSGTRELIFSSSCTVYKPSPDGSPVSEESELSPISPYGFSKYVCERMIQDVCSATPIRCLSLRYFNPVGAEESGLIGEHPKNPQNLLPVVCEVAEKKREKLLIFGNDYPTVDGTPVRDYIHVMDLAEGHSSGLKYLRRKIEEHQSGETSWNLNLGVGTGVSVSQMIQAFKKATGIEIPYEIVGRRAGDPASVVCCTDKAAKELPDWKPRYPDVEAACSHAWKWRTMNPNGFDVDSATGFSGDVSVEGLDIQTFVTEKKLQSYEASSSSGAPKDPSVAQMGGPTLVV